MCGIAGYWSTGPVDLVDLATFTNMLAHRGPDGVSYYAADNSRVGLGHRRLSILDPDPRSSQPMVTDDGRYSIVFNGEVFNFIEIRKELAAKGHRFRTDSDTEVVLHAYVEWGEACQDKFNGMWAFAIWDNVSHSMFFSRDRFGIKPLLYVETPKGVAFASESKAFFALPWTAGTVNTGDESNAPKMLRAGTCATLSGPDGRLQVKRWWQPLNYIEPVKESYPEQIERFRELFFDACRLRLRSDVPVGTAISGGMDSSAVLATVNRLGAGAVERLPQDWSRAFTSVARGTAHDELEYAVAACDAAGVSPVIIDLFERCNSDEMDEYLYLTEAKSFTNLSAWYLYRSMREQGIRVSLDGQGADEILAGYYDDAYRIIQHESSWLRRPGRTLDLLKTSHPLITDSPYVRRNGKLEVALKLLVLSSPPLRGLFRLTPMGRAELPPVVSEKADPEMWEMAKTLPPLNAVMFMQINDGIRPLLERYDLLSMSSSLEIRMPFMDWRLVSYTLSLPSESIFGHGFTKRILRDSMSQMLPPKIVQRKRKLQFQGPIPQLLRGKLKPWVEKYTASHAGSKTVISDGSYQQLREAGMRLTEEWKRETYPRMAAGKVADLKAKEQADPGLMRRRLVETADSARA